MEGDRRESFTKSEILKTTPSSARSSGFRQRFSSASKFFSEVSYLPFAFATTLCIYLLLGRVIRLGFELTCFRNFDSGNFEQVWFLEL